MKRFLVGVLFLLANSLGALPVAADDVTSYAILTETGLLKIRGQYYRLDGIYVPQLSNICAWNPERTNCEVSNAVDALNSKIQGFVRCIDHGKNRDGTLSAYCSHEGEDLGAYLIRNGYAMAAANAPFEYISLENFARHRGVGIWMTLNRPGIQTLY